MSMDRIVFIKRSELVHLQKKIEYWQEQSNIMQTKFLAAQAISYGYEHKLNKLKDQFHVADDAYKAKVEECRQLRKKLELEHKARVAAERIKLETLEMLNQTSEAVEYYREKNKV